MRVRAGVVIALWLGIVACGSTPQVAGEWSGRVAPFHTEFLVLRLTQDGKAIHGTGCYVIAGTPNFIRFRDVPVGGVYPTVKLTSESGWTFIGQFEDEGTTMKGEWHSGTSRDAMNLTRGTAPVTCP